MQSEVPMKVQQQFAPLHVALSQVPPPPPDVAPEAAIATVELAAFVDCAACCWPPVLTVWPPVPTVCPEVASVVAPSVVVAAEAPPLPQL
jgi:hypothetical protein